MLAARDSFNVPPEFARLNCRQPSVLDGMSGDDLHRSPNTVTGKSIEKLSEPHTGRYRIEGRRISKMCSFQRTDSIYFKDASLRQLILSGK